MNNLVSPPKYEVIFVFPLFPNNCELFCLQHTVYKLSLHLPFAVPLEEIKGLTPFNDVADKVHYWFAKAAAGNE